MSAYNINLNIKAANQTGAAFKGARSNMQSLQQQQFAAVKSSKMFQRSIQQAGMQVSDFAVQVGGGQSAILAFTQNAPQFVQSFGAIGGVIAAVISIGGVLALTWSRNRKELKPTAEAMDDLSNSLGEYQRIADRGSMSTANMRKEFGEFSAEIKDLDGFLKSVSLSRVLDSLGTETAMFSRDLGDVTIAIGNLNDKINQQKGKDFAGLEAGDILLLREEAERMASALRLTTDQAVGLDRALSEVQRSKSIEAIRDASMGALVFLRNIHNATGGLSPAMNTLAVELEKVLATSARISETDVKKGIAAAASSAAVLAEELGVSLVLASKILALGTKTDPSLDPRDSSYNAIFAEMQRIKNEYSKVLRNALGIAKVDINKGMREAASSAGRLAKELGVSLGLASKIMALGTKTDPSLDPRDPTYNATFAEMQRIKNEYGKRSPFEPDKNTKKGGGGSSGVDALRKAYDSLLGSLSPAIQASQDFAKAQNTINSAMRAGVITAADAGTAMEMLKYSTSELKDVMGTVESSMSSAFMSMVDGTKTAADAFRDMARDIIKKLYDILVVQRLVGSFDGKTGTGLAGIIGGWMSGGGMFGNFTNVSGVRANGGGISAGSPYIVGERGPELIIPGRSGTVIPNSNLGGGGGNVTINNTFTGGVTRADLGEMIPKIVEASKRAVLDARKRGGSYAAGFGG
jgi:hypothetical protein